LDIFKRRKKIRENPLINYKLISSNESNTSNHNLNQKASKKLIKINISKNIKTSCNDSKIDSQKNIKDKHLLIPGNKNKKLSFKKPVSNCESLNLNLNIKQEAMEKLTKRSKTEHIEEFEIGSLEQIDVTKRLSKDQQSESFNIFKNNLSMPKSLVFESLGKILFIYF